PGYDAKYDIDNYGQGDGVIDIIDIQLAANRWNTEAPFVAPTIPLSPAISPVTVYLNAHPHPSSPSKGEGNMVNLCNALTVDLVADRPINIQALELHLTYDVNRLSLQQADIPAFKAIVQDSQNLVMLLGPSVDESTGILAYGGIVLDKKGTAGVLPKNFIDSSKFYLGSIKNMSYGDFREKEQAVSPVLASLQFIAQQTGTTAIELTDLKIIDTEGYLIPVTVQNQAHVKIAPPPPKSSALAQNYPNPFNPETWIPFKLSSDSHVEINIYNVKGQVVKTLDLGVKEAGYYMDKTSAAHWDGRLKTGERVASGLYFYTIKAGKFIATRRMVMVK
ncbi:T9SS type A sorting domain-containing protein, partial [bacterium]|nr:T9SS type A sorting domain-containing protein [bacterium]